jgi:hypothetical protein
MRVTGVRAYVGLSGVRARMGVIGFLPVIVVRDHVSVIGSCPRERDRVRLPRFGVVAMLTLLVFLIGMTGYVTVQKLG